MSEDGISLETFKMALQWLYTGSREYVETCGSEKSMELICMANLLRLTNLVRICELKLLKTLSINSRLAETYLDFAER